MAVEKGRPVIVHDIAGSDGDRMIHIPYNRNWQIETTGSSFRVEERAVVVHIRRDVSGDHISLDSILRRLRDVNRPVSRLERILWFLESLAACPDIQVAGLGNLSADKRCGLVIMVSIFLVRQLCVALTVCGDGLHSAVAGHGLVGNDL